jgi:hypothetical protein
MDRVNLAMDGKIAVSEFWKPLLSENAGDVFGTDSEEVATATQA